MSTTSQVGRHVDGRRPGESRRPASRDMVWGQFCKTDAQVIDRRFVPDPISWGVVHNGSDARLRTRFGWPGAAVQMTTCAVKAANREWIWKRARWTASS